MKYVSLIWQSFTWVSLSRLAFNWSLVLYLLALTAFLYLFFGDLSSSCIYHFTYLVKSINCSCLRPWAVFLRPRICTSASTTQVRTIFSIIIYNVFIIFNSGAKKDRFFSQRQYYNTLHQHYFLPKRGVKHCTHNFGCLFSPLIILNCF